MTIINVSALIGLVLSLIYPPKKEVFFFIFSLIFWPLSVTREPPLKAKALGSPELLFKKGNQGEQWPNSRRRKAF